MPIVPSLTRRALVRSVAAGAALGGVWGAGLRAVGLPGGPTLSVVGEGTSQLALLDTTDARVLIVLGSPTPDLLDRMPAVLTALRQRIDLLIGDETAVDGIADLLRDRWHIAHELVIPTTLGGRAAPGTARRTSIRTPVVIDLGNRCTATIWLTTRREWEVASAGGDASVLWALNLRRDASEILLGPRSEGVVLATSTSPALVVSPGDDPLLIAEKLHPAAMALNGPAVDDIDDLVAAIATVRIFRDDVARFTLHSEGVSLPSWARSAYSSDSERS